MHGRRTTSTEHRTHTNTIHSNETTSWNLVYYEVDWMWTWIWWALCWCVDAIVGCCSRFLFCYFSSSVRLIFGFSSTHFFCITAWIRAVVGGDSDVPALENILDTKRWIRFAADHFSRYAIRSCVGAGAGEQIENYFFPSSSANDWNGHTATEREDVVIPSYRWKCSLWMSHHFTICVYFEWIE